MAIQWQLLSIEIPVFKFIRLSKQCTVTRNRNDSWPLWWKLGEYHKARFSKRETNIVSIYNSTGCHKLCTCIYEYQHSRIRSAYTAGVMAIRNYHKSGVESKQSVVWQLCDIVQSQHTSDRARAIAIHNVYYMSVFEAETIVFDDASCGKWSKPIIVIYNWGLK